ncbi:MAG TPA: hypothetical protein VHJ78_10565 [Actinomycetota bacterium]|nr:hypothetical protein [Actinomycetota bacterium]
MRRFVVLALFCVLLGCDQGGSPDAKATDAAATSPAAGASALPPPVQTECSAATLSEDVPEPAGLPAAVAMMRKEILKAAVSCDFQLLQQLALRPNGSFQYSEDEESAGPEAQPAQFWAAQEDAGEEPMAHLIGILSVDYEFRPVTEQEGPGTGSNGGYYNWPKAPDPAGYSTSITSAGDWIFFLKQSQPAG